MRKAFLITFVVAMSVPATALADTGAVAVPSMLATGVGIVGLVTAIGLLLDVLALRRVATGAAIADNISYVVAGVACLAASVLSSWASGQMPPEFSPQHTRLAADLLVIASMAFLGIYFYRVRRAMVRFLGAMKGEELLAKSQGATGGQDA